MKLGDAATEIQEADLGQDAPAWTSRLLGPLNRALRAFARVLSGGVSLTDNVTCEVLTANFSHGVTQNVSLERLSRAGGAVVLSADGAIVASQPVVRMAGSGSANVALWFNDSTARSIPVTLVFFPEGVSTRSVPAYVAPSAGTAGCYASYYRLQATGAQAIPSGASTIVNFDAKEDDTDNAVTTGAAWHFTVPANKGGIYGVETCVLLDPGASNVTLVLGAVYRNGAEARRFFYETIAGGTTRFADGTAIGGACKVRCAAGDTLDIRIQQVNDTAAAVNTNFRTPFVYVTIYRLPDLT